VLSGLEPPAATLPVQPSAMDKVAHKVRNLIAAEVVPEFTAMINMYPAHVWRRGGVSQRERAMLCLALNFYNGTPFIIGSPTFAFWRVLIAPADSFIGTIAGASGIEPKEAVELAIERAALSLADAAVPRAAITYYLSKL